MVERPAPPGGSPSSIGTNHGHVAGAAPEPAPQTPDGRLPRRYSGVVPASFISLDHFAWSARMKRANSSGVLPAGSAPRTSIFSRTSLIASTRFTSAEALATLAFGVAAGASRPNQPTASYPYKPDSATVGRSGKVSERLAPVTASAFSLPART